MFLGTHNHGFQSRTFILDSSKKLEKKGYFIGSLRIMRGNEPLIMKIILPMEEVISLSGLYIDLDHIFQGYIKLRG